MGYEQDQMKVSYKGTEVAVSSLSTQTISGVIADRHTVHCSGSIGYAPDPRIAEIAALKAENEKLRCQVKTAEEGWGKTLQWRKDHEADLKAAINEQGSIARFWQHSDEKLRVILKRAFEIILNTCKQCDWDEWSKTAAKFSEDYHREVDRGFKVGASPLAGMAKIMDSYKACQEALVNARNEAITSGIKNVEDELRKGHEAMTNAICQQFALPAELVGKIDTNRPIATKIKLGMKDGRFKEAEVAKMAALKYPSIDQDGKIIPWTAIGCRVQIKNDNRKGTVMSASCDGQCIVKLRLSDGSPCTGRWAAGAMTFLDMPQESPKNPLATFYSGYTRDTPYKVKVAIESAQQYGWGALTEQERSAIRNVDPEFARKLSASKTEYGPSADAVDRKMDQEEADLRSGAISVNEVRALR